MRAQPTRWLDPHEQQAWRSLQFMNMRLEGELARRLAASSELTYPEYLVLVALTDRPDGRLRLFELAEELGWEKSRLSHQVARMTTRGLVAKERCENDRRGAFVVVTERGQREIAAAAPDHVAAVRSLFVERLSRPQLDAVGEAASAVLAGFDAASIAVGEAPAARLDDRDLGGEAPCLAHLFDTDPDAGDSDTVATAVAAGAAVVVDAHRVGEGDGDGVAWSLPHGGDLDANLVRLHPGGAIGEHVNGAVDVAISVVAGGGRLLVDGEPHGLAAGTFAHVPRGHRRAIDAGPDGLVYLSIHRRREALAIGAKPGGDR